MTLSLFTTSAGVFCFVPIEQRLVESGIVPGAVTSQALSEQYAEEDTLQPADVSKSFASDSTLCDTCNSLLRREIPLDHIPSVIRALALFEAHDRSPECDVVALADAFSMLQL